jgi:hypothetical protein
MKIVAYSKVPPTTPFVHLGYLSASTTLIKPIPGLIVGGVILLVAGLSLGGKWLWLRRRVPRAVRTDGQYTPRWPLLGSALVVAAFLTLSLAFVFGERVIYYEHPKGATLGNIWELERRITTIGERGYGEEEAATLPTQEGEYDVRTIASIPSDSRLYREKRVCFDAWSTPLKLRVTRGDGGLKYAVVSAGPDRIMGTPDDITSATRWID